MAVTKQYDVQPCAHRIRGSGFKIIFPQLMSRASSEDLSLNAKGSQVQIDQALACSKFDLPKTPSRAPAVPGPPPS